MPPTQQASIFISVVEVAMTPGINVMAYITAYPIYIYAGKCSANRLVLVFIRVSFFLSHFISYVITLLFEL